MSCTIPLRAVLVLALLSIAWPGRAGDGCEGIPWKFGMSHDEVRAVAECGPYRAFSNGDLETYEASFDGKKENFQFFFEPGGKLRRIGIYVYEGSDLEAAAARWGSLAASMTRIFGVMQSPGNPLADTGQAALEAFSAKAAAQVRDGGKPQMAPFVQPADAGVFASLPHADVQGTTYYTVILFLDAPPENGDRLQPAIASGDIVGATRFLEANPLHSSAPALRAQMIAWENSAEDTVDFICPGVLAPIPDDKVPNSAELLGQFIFGSAAEQLAHPELKDHLVPNQLAGIRSMLAAYAGLLSNDAGARIPRLDELSARDAQGTLAAYLEPIILKECRDTP